ncbi:MAG: hypothetical protein ACOYJA_13290 [Christensenellales bacterium]
MPKMQPLENNPRAPLREDGPDSEERPTKTARREEPDEGERPARPEQDASPARRKELADAWADLTNSEQTEQKQMVAVLMGVALPFDSPGNRKAWQAVYDSECGRDVAPDTEEVILQAVKEQGDRQTELKNTAPLIQPDPILDLWRATTIAAMRRLEQAVAATPEVDAGKPFGPMAVLARTQAILADMSQSWPYALIDGGSLATYFGSEAGRAAVKANWVGQLMDCQARLAVAMAADPLGTRAAEDYDLLAKAQQRLAQGGLSWQERLPLCSQKQDLVARIAQARQGVDLAELAQSALERKQQAEVLPEGPERDQLMRQAEVLSAMAVDPGYTDALWAQREWLLKCIGWAEACQPQREPLLQQRSNLDRCQRPESGLDLIDTYGQFVADTTDARYAAARGQVLAFTQRMRSRREAYAAAALTLEGQQRQYQSLAGRLLERPLSSAQFQQLYNLGSQIAAGRRQLDEQRQAYERDMRAEALRRGLAAEEVTLDAPRERGDILDRKQAWESAAAEEQSQESQRGRTSEQTEAKGSSGDEPEREGRQ